MDKFLKKNLSLISFVLIPIFFLWHPNWLGLLGNQPYWPLFWLLPWAMVHGSISGVIVGLFLGLTLDALSLESSFTQIPGLILCGSWFGRVKILNNAWVGHFRYGLICSIASFVCGALYFIQILIKHIPDNNYFLFFSSIKNILAQVFLTGLFAPIICSQLLKLFKSSIKKNVVMSVNKNKEP